MEENRSRQAARTAQKPIELAAREALEIRLVLSQSDRESIAADIAKASAVLLDRDFDFCQLVSAGDVTDDKGNINAAATLRALKNTAENARKEGDRQRLLYLAQHFESTMKDLRLLKE